MDENFRAENDQRNRQSSGQQIESPLKVVQTENLLARDALLGPVWVPCYGGRPVLD